MSLRELSERLDVSPTTLMHWEDGKVRPDESKARKLWEWLTEDIPSHSIKIEEIDGNRIRHERLLIPFQSERAI